MIVVRTMSAYIDHRVDGGRSPQYLAARLVTLASVKARLRHGFERPVVDPCRQHDNGGGRYVHERAVAAASCFKNADRDCRIFGQPPRDDTPSRACADHDEIEKVTHSGLLPCSRRALRRWRFVQVMRLISRSTRSKVLP